MDLTNVFGTGKTIRYQILGKSGHEMIEMNSKLNSGLNRTKTGLVYKWDGSGLKHDQWWSVLANRVQNPFISSTSSPSSQRFFFFLAPPYMQVLLLRRTRDGSWAPTRKSLLFSLRSAETKIRFSLLFGTCSSLPQHRQHLRQWRLLANGSFQLRQNLNSSRHKLWLGMARIHRLAASSKPLQWQSNSF